MLRLFLYGFGFNDDHLQGVIKRRLDAGMPINHSVTRDPTQNIEQLLGEHHYVIAVLQNGDGAVCRWNGNTLKSAESHSGSWMTFEKISGMRRG